MPHTFARPMPVVVSVYWPKGCVEPHLGFHDNQAAARDYIRACFHPEDQPMPNWAGTVEQMKAKSLLWSIVETNIVVHTVVG